MSLDVASKALTVTTCTNPWMSWQYTHVGKVPIENYSVVFRNGKVPWWISCDHMTKSVVIWPGKRSSIERRRHLIGKVLTQYKRERNPQHLNMYVFRPFIILRHSTLAHASYHGECHMCCHCICYKKIIMSYYQLNPMAYSCELSFITTFEIKT